MVILVDLDGVICTEEPTFERSLANPLPGAREVLSALRGEGHTLIIYTARNWAELKLTKRWLEDHGIPYDGIHMGKPAADRIIDDRAIAFRDWSVVLREINGANAGPPGGAQDEALLRTLRVETKRFLEEIAGRSDLLEPVLEVGPMSLAGSSSGVFQRMPETFLDTKQLFTNRGRRYLSMDIDPGSGPDIVGDFQDASSLLEAGSIGTVLLMSCLEHLPRLWQIPQVMHRILRENGRAFLLTPWNLRFHGPRPDCWRISDDGYRALFEDLFAIEDLQKIDCPDRPLSPIGLKCVIRKESTAGRAAQEL